MQRGCRVVGLCCCVVGCVPRWEGREMRALHGVKSDRAEGRKREGSPNPRPGPRLQGQETRSTAGRNRGSRGSKQDAKSWPGRKRQVCERQKRLRRGRASSGAWREGGKGEKVEGTRGKKRRWWSGWMYTLVCGQGKGRSGLYSVEGGKRGQNTQRMERGRRKRRKRGTGEKRDRRGEGREEGNACSQGRSGGGEDKVETQLLGFVVAVVLVLKAALTLVVALRGRDG